MSWAGKAWKASEPVPFRPFLWTACHKAAAHWSGSERVSAHSRRV